MLKYFIEFFLTIFSITPPTGDQVEILTPQVPKGTGSLNGVYAEIHKLVSSRNLGKVSFPRFPNISKFEIVLGYFNPLLLAFGLASRLPAEIRTETSRNLRYNRYLLYMKLRLLKSLDHPKQYWYYTGILVRRSNVYMMGCLHWVDKNTYRSLTYKQFRQLILTVDGIRGRRNGQMSPFMSYQRSYIPKGTDTFRPLGVPSLAWRVYLNMLLHPLVIYIPIGSSQHGFRPGRGTLTAWKDLLIKVRPSPHIYEFDLKQCFPSISLPRLEWRLREHYRVPRNWASYYTALNFCPPSFKRGVIKLNESQSIALKESMDHIAKCFLSEPVAVYDGLPRMSYFAAHNNALNMQRKYILEDSNPYNYLNKLIKTLPPLVFRPYSTYASDFPGSGYVPPMDLPMDSMEYDPELEGRALNDPRIEWISTLPGDILGSFLDSLRGTPREQDVRANVERTLYGTNFSKDKLAYQMYNHEWVKLVGTAQGSPLSPFLAAVALDEIQSSLPEGVFILLYADDGLIYGPKSKEFVDSGGFMQLMKRKGFTVHPAKSGWVKITNSWVKPLKFLGLTYDGIADLLKASTRKGASIPFRRHDLIQAEYDINFAMDTRVETLLALALRQAVWAISYFERKLYRKSELSIELEKYYRRLAVLKSTLSNIKVGGRLYDAEFDAFIWYYYIFITRAFQMSRDYLLRFLASGVLGLRDKQAVYSYLKDHFTIDGLPNTPSSADFQTSAFRTTLHRGSWVVKRLFGLVMGMFGYTIESDSTSVTKPNSHDYNFPWHRFRLSFLIESGNVYLAGYRNKYTWSNFVKSKYAGFILSRLYNNTYMFDDFVQDFAFKYKRGSIAETLVTTLGLGPGSLLSVFTGTSYAVHAEISLCASVQRRHRVNHSKRGLYYPVKACVKHGKAAL